MTPDTLLVITTSYPVDGDGSEAAGTFVADLANRLAQDLPVRVVAPGKVAGELTTSGGVVVRRFAASGKPLSLLSVGRPSDWLSILRILRSLRREAHASNRDGRVCHVLAMWVLPSGWAARSVATAAGVPYSVWALGSDIWTLARVPLVRSILRRVIAGATSRFADGVQLAMDAGSVSGKPFDFLPSMRRMVRPPRSAHANARHRLLFLGRWHPNKGVDLLLDALELMTNADWERVEDVHIAGGGPLEPLVRARSSALSSRGRPVRASGFLTREVAAQNIAASSWLLIPSRIESIPLIFSDAIQLGCPVIATPVGDLPALVAGGPGDQPCGVVAHAASADAYAQALALALRSDSSDFEAGIARAARLFSMDAIVERLHQAMAPAVNGAS